MKIELFAGVVRFQVINWQSDNKRDETRWLSTINLKNKY